MLEFLKPGTLNVDWVKKWWLYGGISGVAVAVSLFFILVRGCNYGIDFRGGTDVQVQFTGAPLKDDVVRAAIEKTYPGGNAATFGGAGKNAFLLSIQQEAFIDAAKATMIKAALDKKFGAGILKTEHGFEVEADRVEIHLTRLVDVKEIDAVFRELKMPLRPKVERKAAKAGRVEYAIRVRFSEMTAEQKKGIAATLKEQFKDEFLAYDEGIGIPRLVLSKDVDPSAIAAKLAEAKIPLRGEVEEVNKDRMEYNVYLEGLAQKMASDLKAAFPSHEVSIERVDQVWPKAGAKLRADAIAAVLYSLLFMALYIAFRFDLRFAPGAILSLAHDAIITVGFYAMFNLEFTLSTIAAILTVIGYSINDTIVIYDRIRENMARVRDRPLPEMVNRAINDMMARTILTSSLTLFTVFAIFAIAGGSLADFSTALLVGMISGVYSTIAVAAQTTLVVDKLWSKSQARKREAVFSE
ncbi:MAG: protein translocase subunit SecF [Deltaproteobacteria bacterium]|nr:protein translocase subunit SecF [Deltaproteobacteria bacterium]